MPSSLFLKKRRGFTLVELLVVIAIIGTLVGLLLPAVQSARESARKSSCGNNVRQMSLGAANYESANGRYPTSGEGKIPTYDSTGGITGYSSKFNLESFQVQILPFIEQVAIASNWNKKLAYWDTTATTNAPYGNCGLATAKISTFLCPSNAMYKEANGGSASAGSGVYYGSNDYMPVVYVDISGDDGTRVGSTSKWYKRGVLRGDQDSKVKDVLDGTSNSVMFFEDAGREKMHVGAYTASGAWLSTAGATPVNITPASVSGDMVSGMTCPNRWADSDNGSGVSGPPDEQSGTRTRPIINNTKTPIGGSSSTCLWTSNNCGPNDEPFSFHAGGGCYAGFADGSVHWMAEALDPQVIRQLCDPVDGEQPKKYE